jgi:hypothetical protein
LTDSKSNLKATEDKFSRYHLMSEAMPSFDGTHTMDINVMMQEA